MKRGEALVARTASMTSHITPAELHYFRDGALAVFRLYRKSMIERMRRELGNPAEVILRIKIGMTPAIYSERAYYLTIRVTEVLK